MIIMKKDKESINQGEKKKKKKKKQKKNKKINELLN